MAELMLPVASDLSGIYVNLMLLRNESSLYHQFELDYDLACYVFALLVDGGTQSCLSTLRRFFFHLLRLDSGYGGGWGGNDLNERGHIMKPRLCRVVGG